MILQYDHKTCVRVDVDEPAPRMFVPPGFLALHLLSHDLRLGPS